MCRLGKLLISLCVQAFFSTVFVDYPDSADSSGLRLHAQVWVALICTMTLVAMTWSWFYLWERRNVKAPIPSELQGLTKDDERCENKDSK